MVIHFFLNLINKSFNKIERPENQTKKLNLVSVQNKMELTTLNNFLKSKNYNIISFIIYFIDNSLDQKKLNEYNFTLNSDSASNISSQAIKGKIKNIDAEIDFLTELSMLVQEKNEKYKNIIEEKMKNNSGYQTIDEEFEYDFENLKNDKLKIKTNNSKKLEKIYLTLKNCAYHIYKLQLTQFSESIKRIYQNSKTKQYFITFDNTNDEEIPSIVLNEKDYNNLISIRDKYANNDILSSFISKEDCVNPNSLKNLKRNKCLTPIKNKNNHNNKNNCVIIHQKKSKDDAYMDISNNIFANNTTKGNMYYLSSYNICHQCKLQKIDEDLIRCQYIHIIPHTQSQNINVSKKSQKNITNENPINYFFIGQSAIILTNKIYYLKNYDDSVKELVDNYFVHKLKETNKKCEKYYCKNCLRSIYDIDINEIKKKSFKCPACNNRCNCSRCIRYENLIKQIAYYLNNYGDIDKLYNYLVEQNSIFEKLKDYLVLGKFICIDFNTKNYTPLKLNSSNSRNSNNSSDVENKNTELNSLELLKYKKNLEKIQIDFCNIYDETNLQKQLYDTEMFKIKESNNNNNKDKKEINKNNKNNKKLIGRKVKNPKKRKK